MSKIEKELVEATGVEPKKSEGRQDFLGRLANATADLNTKAWDKLSVEAQDWYNDNADARNDAKEAKKPLPDFADFKDIEQEEEPRSRRRSSSDDGDKGGKPAKEEKPSADKLEEGQRVKIATKRRDIEGVVIENNAKKEFVVVKEEGGKEREIEYDEIESLEVFHGDAGKGGAADEPDAGEAEPAVGDEVELENKRGKTFTGKITELTDDEIVIETKDGAEDFARDRVASIKVLKKAKGAAKPAEKAAGKGSKAKEEPAAENTRARSADGVPIGTKIKQAIADNLQATEAEITAILKKSGLDVKENTLALNYAECHKLLKELHSRDLLNVKKFKPMV